MQASVDVVDVKLHYFVVMTYSGSSMCLDLKADVKVLSRANPLVSPHLMEMVLIVLLRHWSQDPASEETVLPKVMACPVAHLDAPICFVNVLHLCWSSLMMVEGWGSGNSRPRAMIGSSSEDSYSFGAAAYPCPLALVGTQDAHFLSEPH